jgi:hypothetical protein
MKKLIMVKLIIYMGYLIMVKLNYIKINYGWNTYEKTN